MSIHCKECGAVAGRGYEIGHRSDCPTLRAEPVRIPRHTFGPARLMTEEEKAMLKEARAAPYPSPDYRALLEEAVEALAPLARKQIPKNVHGNAGIYSFLHDEIQRAAATHSRIQEALKKGQDNER